MIKQQITWALTERNFFKSNTCNIESYQRVDLVNLKGTA